VSLLALLDVWAPGNITTAWGRRRWRKYIYTHTYTHIHTQMVLSGAHIPHITYTHTHTHTASPILSTTAKECMPVARSISSFCMPWRDATSLFMAVM
jgi:hypothetical protein